MRVLNVVTARTCLCRSPPGANGESSAMMRNMKNEEPLGAPNGDRHPCIDSLLAWRALPPPWRARKVRGCAEGQG